MAIDIVEREAGPTGLGDRGLRGSVALQLFVASFLMLFVELVLIRWAAAHVVHVASYTNFVLLASFLGIGIGFLLANHGGQALRIFPVALAAYLALTVLLSVRVTRGNGSRVFVGFMGLPAPPPWVALTVVFVGAAIVMGLVAHVVAVRFARFAPLTAYRLDILGSLAGILGFSALAFLGAGPWAWAIVIVGTILWLAGRRPGAGAWVSLAVLAGVLVAASAIPRMTWSPYYRVWSGERGAPGVPIAVNNIPHQSMRAVSTLRDGGAIYAVPFELTGRPPGEVLIIGAGTGNDVAVALDEGARRVDAVEIDPVLYGIGRDEHPDRPYADPRVTAHVNDGRAFLHRTTTEYDLVLFALPDSLTAVTQSSLRLENYLFTEQALEEVKDRLAPGGVFAMYNYYRPHVLDRFAATITSVFGMRPCLEVGREFAERRQAVLAASLDPDVLNCSERWTPTEELAEIGPATDDRPFPYLTGWRIPPNYVSFMVLLLLGSAVAVRVVSGPLTRMAGYTDLFFMGVAFLLLETKSVVGFALLFGTTWFVNALVFAGVLVSVLAAIEVARRVRLARPGVLYVVLLASVGVAWLVPAASLLSLSPVPRFAVATAITFAPIFLANLVFAHRFRSVGASTVAFGANLLGAMVGGVLEYLSLMTGYGALLILVAVLYAAAFVAGRKHLRPAAEAPAPDTAIA